MFMGLDTSSKNLLFLSLQIDQVIRMTSESNFFLFFFPAIAPLAYRHHPWRGIINGWSDLVQIHPSQHLTPNYISDRTSYKKVLGIISSALLQNTHFSLCGRPRVAKRSAVQILLRIKSRIASLHRSGAQVPQTAVAISLFILVL
jgi:hypothetical protein